MPSTPVQSTTLTLIHSFFKRLLGYILITFRLLFGPVRCSFAIGCTTYAVIQLREQPFARAVWYIAKRLVACTFPGAFE